MRELRIKRLSFMVTKDLAGPKAKMDSTQLETLDATLSLLDVIIPALDSTSPARRLSAIRSIGREIAACFYHLMPIPPSPDHPDRFILRPGPAAAILLDRSIVSLAIIACDPGDVQLRLAAATALCAYHLGQPWHKVLTILRQFIASSQDPNELLALARIIRQAQTRRNPARSLADPWRMYTTKLILVSTLLGQLQRDSPGTVFRDNGTISRLSTSTV